ncbi:MAG TPA: hypothetical protein VGN80_12135 [Devosiaceae bacterium]|jgi:hypothetical protein|nr:hypothetical protein [Devosiaceae bacterium]
MPKSDEFKAREERLAAKLRENLKRRKSQAKARGAGESAATRPPQPPSPKGAGDG